MDRELYQRGLDKARIGDYQGAIKEFDRALKLNPQFADAYYQRGLARFDLKDIAGAIQDYNQTLQLNSNNIDAYFARGLARLVHGDIPGCLEDISQLLLINPHHAHAYKLRASALQKLGDKIAATAHLKKAAELYLQQKDAANCRQCLESINKIKSSYPSYNPNYQQDNSAKEFIKQALNKAIAGQYAAAIEDFNWLVQLHPQDEQAYYHRGLIYAKQGNFWLAIEDFTQTLRIQPNSAAAYYHRGIARSNLGDSNGAKADFSQAANLFERQGNTVSYQQALAKLNKPQVSETETKQRDTRFDYSSKSKKQAVDSSRVSNNLAQKLLRLVGGNLDTAYRLVELEKKKNLGQREDWYWEKVIYYLERDRQS